MVKTSNNFNLSNELCPKFSVVFRTLMGTDSCLVVSTLAYIITCQHILARSVTSIMGLLLSVVLQRFSGVVIECWHICFHLFGISPSNNLACLCNGYICL